MDRCDVGFGFGVVSGVISLLQSTVYLVAYVSSVPIEWGAMIEIPMVGVKDSQQAEREQKKLK